ncbi:MAG: hypothetical protein ACR2OA_20175 [Rubripirellula sp.]
MPLQQIAHQIITLADRRASTPVLVTPPYLSFRKQFFAELSRELADHTERDLRIDWYRNLPSVRTILSDQLAAWHVKSVNRLLSHMTVSKARQAHKTATNSTPAESAGTTDINVSRQPALDQPRALLTQHATVQITATIARPGGQGRDLVIGLSDARQKLPNWTTAIWLGTSAQEVERWQAA